MIMMMTMMIMGGSQVYRVGVMELALDQAPFNDDGVGLVTVDHE